MRTVAWLKNELSKFPDDALCFAYEGEVVGLVIELPGPDGCRNAEKQGVIYCSEEDDQMHETELLIQTHS